MRTTAEQTIVQSWDILFLGEDAVDFRFLGESTDAEAAQP
jgi:hypothetical protein